MPVPHSRGHCMPFWSMIPPLQVAPSFACSVASLSQSPGHQLPGCHSLHCGILTDYQLGWGRPSTWFTRHADAPSRSNTLFPKGDRRMDTPSGRPSLSYVGWYLQGRGTSIMERGAGRLENGFFRRWGATARTTMRKYLPM